MEKGCPFDEEVYNPEYVLPVTVDLKLLVSANLIKILKKRKMSKAQLSFIMGVSPSIISRWTSGKHNFTLSTIEELQSKLYTKLI